MMKEEMQRRRAEVQKERQGSGLSGSIASFTNIRTGTGKVAKKATFGALSVGNAIARALSETVGGKKLDDSATSFANPDERSWW